MHYGRYIDFRTLTLTFGKYRGESIGDIPGDYLEWMLENIERLSEKERAYLESVVFGEPFDFGEAQTPPKTSQPLQLYGAPAGVTCELLKEIVTSGRRHLARQYHPDLHPLMAEKMKHVNMACDWLEERLRHAGAGR